MLQIAKKKNTGNNIRFFCQDILELCLPNKVDLITCNGDTLNYLTDKKYLSRAIDACYKNLNMGGCFMFDIIAGGRCGEAGETIVQDITLGNVRSIWTISTDFARKTSISDILTCFRQNNGCTKTIRELHLQRWHGVPLMSRFLKQSGFSLRDVIEVDTLRRATPDSFWVKFIAVKK
jgi:SAM-dependent methyltransferase